MSNEEKYRETMRRLLEAKQFEPTEEVWASTSLYLDKQKRKKRRRILIWMSCGGILLLSLSSLFLFGPKQEEKTTDISQKTEEPLKNKKLADIESSDQEVTTSAIMSQQEKNHVPPTQETQSNDKRSTSNKLKIGKSEIQKSEIKKSGDHETQIHAAPRSGEKLVTNNLDRKVGSAKFEANMKKRSKGENTMLNNTLNETSGKNAGNTEITLTKTKKTDPVLQDPVVKAVVDQKVSTRSEAIPEKIEAVAENPTKIISKDSVLSKKEPVLVSVVKPTVTPLPDTNKAEPQLPSYLALEAGLGYFPNWNKSSFGESSFLQPVFGLSFNKNITKKLLLGLGICYYRLSDLQPSTVSSSVTTFGYGEESSVVEVTPLRMHYLAVPLRFGWQLKPRQSLWMGCNFSYLFAVEAKVERYKEQMGNSFDRSNYVAGGYTEGFRVFYPQLTLMYRNKVQKYLALQIEFAYGLGNLKEQGFFNTSQQQKGTGIKLSLVYTLANFGR